MLHVVLSHIVSLWIMPGRRNPVRQDGGRAREHRRDATPIGGTQSRWWYATPLPVLRRMVGAPTYGRYTTPMLYCISCRYVGPWSVPTPMAGTQGQRPCPRATRGRTHRRCSPPRGGAHAHGRGFGPWFVLGAWSVPKASARAQVYGPCSGSWLVPPQKTEARRPALRSTRPNMGVQATANSVRCAPALCRA
jgi:hypothetical protein